MFKKVLLSSVALASVYLEPCLSVRPEDTAEDRASNSAVVVSASSSSDWAASQLNETEERNDQTTVPSAALVIDQTYSKSSPFEGPARSSPFFQALFRKLDRKTFLALGATSKSIRTDVTKTLMLNDPRCFHLIQWNKGPKPKMSMDKYRWNDALAENNWMNYLIGRTVWFAQTQVFTVLENLSDFQHQIDTTGYIEDLKAENDPLALLVERFDDSLFEKLPELKTTFANCYRLLQTPQGTLTNNYGISLGFPYWGAVSTRMKGRNLPERDMALFSDRFIQVITERIPLTGLGYIDGLTEDPYYDAPSSPKTRSVSERLSHYMAVKLEIDMIQQNPPTPTDTSDAALALVKLYAGLFKVGSLFNCTDLERFAQNINTTAFSIDPALATLFYQAITAHEKSMLDWWDEPESVQGIAEAAKKIYSQYPQQKKFHQKSIELLEIARLISLKEIHDNFENDDASE